MVVADVAYNAPAGPRRIRTVIDVPPLQQLCSSVHRGRYPPSATRRCVTTSSRLSTRAATITTGAGRLLLMFQLYEAGLLPGPFPLLLGVLSGRTPGSTENDCSQSSRREPGRSCPPSFSTHSRAGPRCHDCGVELTDLRERITARESVLARRPRTGDYSFEQADLTGSRAVDATGDRRRQSDVAEWPKRLRRPALFICYIVCHYIKSGWLGL